MTLTDELDRIRNELQARDAELARLKAENESQRIRLAKQAGAQDENRGQNAQLLRELIEARELIGTYQSHFHTFHGSAEHIKAQEKALAGAGAPTAPVKPVPARKPSKLRDRINGLVAGAAA